MNHHNTDHSNSPGTIFDIKQHSLNNRPIIERPNTPTYARNVTRHLSELEPDTTALWGWILLFTVYCIFIGSMYAIVVSKFMPETGNKTLDWIKIDEYYCLLIPITLLVTIHAIFWNWLGMKFFRHN
ncbi:26009_t:CDS:2 [Dentiscutata erythropus]|uniref:26009_t:CDS:1 n=1 Tax=Dentiscutata erythropus TaxID=1348616 RepID=A0A9N9CRP9_9GLOM|nr:26009_t:CDS:2 [Dentiscutata erythropus]